MLWLSDKYMYAFYKITSDKKNNTFLLKLKVWGRKKIKN